MIINLTSQTDLSGFHIIFEGSTNIERKGIFGISHLSEHLMCKAYEHLENDFERRGIYSNAYTSSNEIVFHLNGLDEYLKDYRQEVLDLLLNFMPTKEQFEHEKNIVLKEYIQYFSDQEASHWMNLYRKCYNDYCAIGSREDIESMTYEDMVSFIKEQYAHPSKIINVSKNSPFVSDVKFSNIEINKVRSYIENNDYILDANNNFGDTTSVMFISDFITEDFAIIKFICNMLSYGLQSPLFQEVREKRGLVYGINSGINRYNKQGLIDISALTSNDKTDELINTIKEVLTNPDKYLTQERFDIVKESKEVLKKTSEIYRYLRVEKWIDPIEWSLDDILSSLTLDKVKEVYNKHFDMDKFRISIDKTEF